MIPLDSPHYTVHVMGSREEWKAARFLGIGASEWAACLGMDPRRSPLEVYADKRRMIEDAARGIAPQSEPEDPDEMEEWLLWGQLLQRPVASETCRRHGYSLTDPGAWTILRSTLFPWMFCTLDYAVQEILPAPADAGQYDPAPVGPWGALECKNMSGWLDADWLPGTGGPPVYQVQLQAQLATTGWTWGALAGLLGGNRLRHHRHARHDSFIDAAVVQLDRFWSDVLEGRPPKPDHSASSGRGLEKLYEIDGAPTVELPPLGLVHLACWDEAQALRARADELEAEASQEVQALMGAATYATIPGEPDRVFSWKRRAQGPQLCQGCGAVVRKGWAKRILDVVKAKGRTR